MKRITFERMPETNYTKTEAFNSLRTNIQFSGSDVRVVMITSCAVNEGKSTIAFGLAKSIAESGRSVLFIDADMRKSVISNRYGIVTEDGETLPGLTNLLSMQAEVGDILCKTNIENMYMIQAGDYSPNPADILEGPLFPTLIQELRKIYDFIVVDTPPLGVVIDAATIAPYTDGTVLVVESGFTSYRMARDVKDQIETANCKLLGVVLNKIDNDAMGRYYRYGRYGKYGRYARRYKKYYQYYYTSDDSKKGKKKKK